MTPEQKLLLEKYVEAVLAAPAHLHLTADRNAQLFWNRHIMDAVSILDGIPAFYKEAPSQVLDVGSGNGIPGIPFSVLMPIWSVYMLDSDNKKCGFIESFCNSSAIFNAHVLAGRAESFAHGPIRSTYDIVIARALSKARVAIELSVAFVKVGGILIVPHGTSWGSELGDIESTLDLLGLSKPSIQKYSLDKVEYTSLMFNKIVDTPSKYPRAVGVPAKRPL